jgi:hypothetical protein
LSTTRGNRLNAGAVLAVFGAFLLFISEFIHWSGGQSLWAGSRSLDVVFLLLELLTLGLFALILIGRALPAGLSAERGLHTVGLIATVLVLFLLEASDKGFGIYLGLIGALAILIGGALAQTHLTISAPVVVSDDAPGGAGAPPRTTAPPGAGQPGSPPPQPGPPR